MKKHLIESKARELQKLIFDSRDTLFPGYKGNLHSLIEPRFLAQLLNVSYHEIQDLSSQVSSFRDPKQKVAGLVDRKRNLIYVGTEFPKEVQRFTAFHEMGHWILHPNLEMHRDMPLKGIPKTTRPIVEREADYFAASFLMPRKLLRKEFVFRFGSDELIFHNTNAHQLCPEQAYSLLNAPEKSLDRELAVARCRSFGNKYFPSLADRFTVSDTAMAIRLKELRLIQWP